MLMMPSAQGPLCGQMPRQMDETTIQHSQQQIGCFQGLALEVNKVAKQFQMWICSGCETGTIEIGAV